MKPVVIAYFTLAFAVMFEVIATASLAKSAQFTKVLPVIFMIVCYAASFFLMSQALRAIPLGIAYAVWAGFGIILTAMVSVVLFRQTLDTGAIVGITMIVAGVVVANVFSKSLTH
ncbi:multidrug efflux SMR transporter [Rhizobium sp. 2MFCol3.1]|uniref:DMT family transporter n=1 Tax=Rhizobium sp. 2MFCol3.1 TaxID=1246459 RepID=UPI0003652464|nr:multidrug efflux SMR transporter [Rhizobium sp. 2MFCol3.1]